jgi:outer membrane immunogenic protein
VFAPAIPVFTWTGFYVGVNAGYAWADSNRNDDVIFFTPGSIVGSPTTTGTLTLFNNNGGNDDGFTAGGTLGFNYQMGAVVLGVEGDLNWADIGGNNSNNNNVGGTYNFAGVLGLAFAPPPATIVTNGRGGIDWFGTIRARAGVAFDRALIFATGGFAFGGGGNNNGFCGGFVGGGCGGDDDWRGGWTAGGGVEYAFTNNLTAKVEGLYVNLGKGDNNTVGAVYNLPTNTLFLGNGRNGDDAFGLVRVGVNYKFGS